MADGHKDVPLDQVEWRVDSEPYDRNGRTVCRWVPYLNAPIVARLLDEWVGPDGWSDRYEPGQLAGKEVLWCHLDVGGVVKSDVGVASNTEAQKGMVSDAFKRAACLKWGVGRNVYDLPTLFAPCNAREGKGGKRVAYANDQTLPDLLRQLKARGFNVDGGRVQDEAAQRDDAPEGVNPQTGEITAPSVTGDVDAMKPRELAEALAAHGLEQGGTVAEMRERLRSVLAQVGGEDADSPPAEGNPAPVSPPAGEAHGYDLWSRDELADACKDRQLPHSGNKDRLIAELRAFDAANGIVTEYDTPQW